LMRGHQRQGDGRLERDTRLKREKRYLLTSPGHYCAGVLLYKENTVQALIKRLRSLCLLLVAILLLEAMPIFSVRAGDEVIVRNVRFESSGQVITIFYDLQGPAENRYQVKLLLKRRQEPSFEYAPRSLTGDVGEGPFAGTNRQMVWEIQKDSLGAFGGTDFYFVVEAEMISSRTNILWYIGGGAAVVAGAAAVFLGKSTQNGAAAPDVFPKPIRPGGN